MANILTRFADIMSANVNAMLDKLEDPAKMCDQYIRDMTEDLAEVKRETANVMAEEKRAKRLYEDNLAEIEKYLELAKKALTAGNDEDAKVFIAKKQELETLSEGLKVAYDAAAANSEKMKQLHDKLTKDIADLKARRETIKAKVAVAKTQETVNKYAQAADRHVGAMNAFSRMEEKADRMLDVANAEAELDSAEEMDAAAALEAKYSKGSSQAVDDELAAMKEALGVN
ncbi:MAG: PspA/IM30 family protein [Pseudobutyrivibrio sp.]|nr:PspA/IM30 family protein [Pseudobutyrivibrio sp.]